MTQFLFLRLYFATELSLSSVGKDRKGRRGLKIESFHAMPAKSHQNNYHG